MLVHDRTHGLMRKIRKKRGEEMQKYGTHGDGANILQGDTVTTPEGKQGIVSNVIIGTGEPKFLVLFPDQTSNVYSRHDLTRINS